MSFEFKPAKREHVRLLVGLAGPTGSGKTYTALRLAKGLADGDRFALLDTENGRALHYADEFDFDHGELTAPFSPSRYSEAIQAADNAGYPVIVVDSASHEHAGEGGLLDMHEDVLARMAGNDWRKRESSSMAAWVEPKREHKRFVGQLLQLRAHLILCFRAEEKVEMVKDEKGRWVIQPKRSLVGIDGWLPIAEKNLPYELTVSMLFTSERPGVPKPIKMQAQHRLLIPLDKPVSEEVGTALSVWARGNSESTEEGERIAELTAKLFEFADELGNRDTVTAEVQKNRRRHRDSPERHAAWLEAQIARAQSTLDELIASEDAQGASDDEWDSEMAPTGRVLGGPR